MVDETKYEKAAKLLMKHALSLGGTDPQMGGKILTAVKIIMDEKDSFQSRFIELLKDMQIQTEPTGPYSMNHLDHASNVIEHMKDLAKKSLIKAIGDDKNEG